MQLLAGPGHIGGLGPVVFAHIILVSVLRRVSSRLIKTSNIVAIKHVPVKVVSTGGTVIGVALNVNPGGVQIGGVMPDKVVVTSGIEPYASSVVEVQLVPDEVITCSPVAIQAMIRPMKRVFVDVVIIGEVDVHSENIVNTCVPSYFVTDTVTQANPACVIDKFVVLDDSVMACLIHAVFETVDVAIPDDDTTAGVVYPDSITGAVTR